MQRNAVRIKKISRAIELYLVQRTKHEVRMAEHQRDFEMGKRHLANMMGRDPYSDMSQVDIDRAIQYLFPAGMFDKRSRPMMKPPEQIFPKFLLLDFENNRPKHTLFYTARPRFYSALSEVNRITQRLVYSQDAERLRRGGKAGAVLEKELELSGNGDEDDEDDDCAPTPAATDSFPSAAESASDLKPEWISFESLKKKFDGEEITADMHASLVLALDHLSSLPLAHTQKAFLDYFRELHGIKVAGKDRQLEPIWRASLPEVQVDPATGRRYTVAETEVKGTKATVKTLDAGTGDCTIDGFHYSQMRSLLAREVLLAPMVVTGMFGKVDVVAEVWRTLGGTTKTHGNRNHGHMVVPRAVRNGAALGLAALYPEHKETLRLAGLLSHDPRYKERNKIDQRGARGRWRWNKR